MNNELIERAAENMERMAEENRSLKDRLESLDRSVTELAQRSDLAPDNYRGSRKNPLREAATNPEIAELIAHKRQSVIMTMNGGINLLRKTTIVGSGDESDYDPLDIDAERDPGLHNDPRRPLSILDVLPTMKVGTGRFEYIALMTRSNAAAEVAEDAEKPEASVPTELKTATIATVAHHLPVTEQVLADAPFLMQRIQSLLRYDVASKAEDLIVNGTGTIDGLNTLGTTFISGEDFVADRIGAAIAELEVDGYRPSHIFMNPRDWQDVRGERSQVENFYTMGSAAMPIKPALWSLPVVTSAAVTEGTAYVLDSQHVSILDRQQITVQMGYIDQDFTHNRVRIRVEARLGLAVFSPGGVFVLDTTPGSGG